ncbi:MAG: Zn-ribbon domain-containing OB-fold protein [Actinomycetota bacterium]
MFEKLTDPTQVRLWRGNMPVSHHYTAGIAGERFFRMLKDRGAFLATRCGECAVTYCPARAFCERCLAELDEYFEVGPRGVLESFTVVHRDLDDRPLDEPVAVGLIRLEGADTCFVHRLAGDRREGLRIGFRVEPVLKPQAQRSGHLDDVEYFRPLPEPDPGR